MAAQSSDRLQRLARAGDELTPGLRRRQRWGVAVSGRRRADATKPQTADGCGRSLPGFVGSHYRSIPVCMEEDASMGKRTTQSYENTMALALSPPKHRPQDAARFGR